MKTYAVRTHDKNWVDVTETGYPDPYFMPEHRARRVAEEVGGKVEVYEVTKATRHTAADALATKAEKLLELHRKHIGMGYLVNEVFELDAALREYREVNDAD